MNVRMRITILRLVSLHTLLFPGTSTQETRVTYTSKTEQLNCSLTGVTAQWSDLFEDGSGNTLFAYLGDPDAVLNTTSDSHPNKYWNFDYDVVGEPAAAFNMIIRDVDKDDGGEYQCTNTPGDSISGILTVEVLGSVTITAGSSTLTTLTVNEGLVYNLTCTTTGARSGNELELIWTPGDGAASNTIAINSTGDDSSLVDYSRYIEYTANKKDTQLGCILTGYVNDDEIDDKLVSAEVALTIQYSPECILSVTTADSEDCQSIQMTCSCSSVPDVSNCSFYQDEMELDLTADLPGCSVTHNMTIDTSTNFSCQATNDVGTGISELVEYECYEDCDPYFFGGDCSQNCDCSREGSTGCNHVDGRCFCSPGYIGDRCEKECDPYFFGDGCSQNCNCNMQQSTGCNHVDGTCMCSPEYFGDRCEEEFTPSPDTCCSCTEDTCACTGHVAGLVVESVIIALLLGLVAWSIFNITRDSTKGFRGNQDEGHSGNDNSAYMDLHERNTSTDGEPRLLEVPAENVKIISQVPGSGLMVYSKAMLTTSSGNKDAVVKSPSGKAPIDLEKIWSPEIEALVRLPGDVNLVQTLGWCSSIPKMLLFEYINGTNLVTHLTENFSMHKVHQYGNTKRQRFEVPETGRVENLPRYALDVARGLKFLLAKEFVHPGVRARKVLVDLSGKCKIYDFVSVDRAKEMTSLLWEESAPYQWMSPEFLLLDTVAPPGDVWSFGVLMWEIYSYGSQPYPGEERSEVETSLRRKERLAMPKNCPGAIWQLMNRCWDQSVDTRPKIQEIASNLAAMCNDDKEYDVIPKGGIGNDQV